MALELRDCYFFGPALPEPFVKLQLEGELKKRKLLPNTKGDEGRAMQDRWEVYRRKLRALGEHGGERRVASHVLEPLVERLGYKQLEPQAEVITREGPEDGGWLYTAADGRVLRAWSVGLGVDLDAPSRRGRAYRFSPSRVAQRVLLASSERAGLLTDGEELRLLLCDPARPDSHVAIRLDRSGGWRAARGLPDSYRLLLALASPDGVGALPDLAEAARLAQTTVTKKLRLQARRAIEGFLQELLDHPQNAAVRQDWTDPAELARALWREGLILVYRLLFVFKLESSADPARAFSFAATSLWRNTYSPNTALASLVRRVLDEGADTGGFLENGLRTLWRMFAEGMSSSELEIMPLGGMLFGAKATPLLDRMQWGERGVARLLDALLWTPGDGKTERERVHYGALDVEDLGRVYEALLELEPGITAEPMCRLRRTKLEVVVPVAQGAPYRTDQPATDPDDEDEADGQEDEGKPRRGAKTNVQFIEEIPAGRFFLRVGLGRKASGSYYTPHPFVRFLVQETLGPQLTERSPKEDPHPGRILELKVLDPAMGSGHFLVGACRYLGEALYEACRLCDELAVQAEEQAEKAPGEEREALLANAAELRKRVEDLPDPEDELIAYLPSRAAEGEESGLSQRKAEALCRRLVAVHCLYGVDKNPLAVELAKLSLWLESYAEGLPLTFMDHRLIQGDSLTGPFFEHLLTYPKSGEKLDDLFAQDLTERLRATLAAALVHVRDLEASVGKDVADLEHKRTAKEKLDAALAPLKSLAAAWSGGVMLGDECDDAGYQALAQAVAAGDDSQRVVAASPRLRGMIATSAEAVSFDLMFPEVYPREQGNSGGFDAVVGNPPWNKVRLETREFEQLLSPELLLGKECGRVGIDVESTYQQVDPYASRLRGIWGRFTRVTVRAGEPKGDADEYQYFLERSLDCSAQHRSSVGLLLPGGFMKNPADAPWRRYVADTHAVGSASHFHNSGWLFAELPPVAEFSALVALHPWPPASWFAYDLRAYPAEGAPASATLCSEQDVRDSVSVTGLFPGLQAVGRRAAAPDLLSCLSEHGIQIRNDLHRRFNEGALKPTSSLVPGTDDARPVDVRKQLLRQRAIPCYSSRSISQHESESNKRKGKWRPDVDVCADLDDNAVKALLRRLLFYRLVIRSTCGSPKTNERSCIACFVPPLTATSNSLWAESEPDRRPTAGALAMCAVMNSCGIDSLARPLIGANFNKGIMRNVEAPTLDSSHKVLLVHSAIRLESASPLFASLWTEQLGDAWREPTPKHTWPVLAGDDARWAVRAAIDAVVADAYGLDWAQYEHVLSTFSHKSYRKAPELCLAAFDDLKAIGIEAFTKKHDPYWDIPLNESLPKPVIDLPIPGEEKPAPADLGPLFDWTEGVAAAPAETEIPPSAPPAQPQPAWMARTPIDRQVLILSRVVDAHQRANRLSTLGNVKAEKVVYLVEAHAGIDLERAPIREAAGPADFQRLKKAVHRGAKLHAFSMRGGSGGSGGVWSPADGLRKRLGEYDDLFAAERSEIDRIIELLVPMDTEQVEIVATLYACWNDLIARGMQPDDASIIEDFHGWAPGKQQFDADRLGKALEWMRTHDLVPSGSAPPTKARGLGDGKEPRSGGRRSSANEAVYALVTKLLDARGVISSKEAQTATGLDAGDVRPYLKRLVEEGRAATEGQRRGMKYRRVDG